MKRGTCKYDVTFAHPRSRRLTKVVTVAGTQAALGKYIRAQAEWHPYGPTRAFVTKRCGPGRVSHGDWICTPVFGVDGKPGRIECRGGVYSKPGKYTDEQIMRGDYRGRAKNMVLK
jgi:hypothetical protein